MGQEPIFKVDLRHHEPHVLGAGRGHKTRVKTSLRDKIIEKVGGEEIEVAKQKLDGSRLRLEVEFYLWKGAPNVTETRRKKDIDNLLKVVLDVLQERLKEGGGERGLGLVERDEDVWEILARKEIVDYESDEGISIRIFKT